MENKRILVVGGTGYIGKEIVAQLLEDKYDVSVLSRHLKSNTQFDVLRGSVLDKSFLMKSLAGFDVIIYLAAIVRTLNKAKYDENVVGIKNTVEAMLKNKLSKIIYFSTQNIHITKTGPYGDSKKISEKIISSSNLDFIIVRPNYVYGIDKDNDFFRLINIIRKTGICPVISDGNMRFQPINKKDVALITSALIKSYQPKLIADLSGDTTVTLNEVLDFLKESANLKFIRLHIPLFFLKPFKKLIPFDIDGYNSDRLSKTSYLSNTAFNIKEDLLKIAKLY